MRGLPLPLGLQHLNASRQSHKLTIERVFADCSAGTVG